MKKQHLKHLFVLFLSTSIFYACLQSDLFEDQLSLPPEIAAAKMWYEMKIGGSSLYWRVGERSGMLEADWQNAFADDDVYFRVIEVPLSGDQQFSRMSSEVFERIRSTGDRRYLASAMRLLIRICEETNEKDAFVMTVSPDLEYLSKNLDNPLRSFTFLNRGEEFSGSVFFYDMTSTFVSGYKVVGGEVFQLFSHAMMANQPQLRSGHSLCHITIDLIDWYVNGNFQHTQLVNIQIECHDIGGGGTGGGIPSWDTGGLPSWDNSSGSGSVQPSEPSRVTADMIFCKTGKNEMFSMDWIRVVDAINEIWDDCMGEVLLNAIANNLGSDRLNIRFQAGEGSQIDPNTGAITIGRNDPTSMALLHELFHFFQIQIHGISDWRANALNREIEAWFAEYAFSRRAARDSGNTALIYMYHDEDRWGYAFEALGSLFSLNSGNVRPGESQNVESRIKSDVLPSFRAQHPGQLFNYNWLSNPQQMFRNLQQLSINC